MENTKITKEVLSHQLEERLQFEQLITKLSARFLALSVEELDEAINDALKQIGNHLGIDRIALLEFSKDEAELHLTHGYSLRPPEHPPKFLVSSRLPWFTGTLRGGQMLRISSIDEIPKDATPEQQYCKDQGLKAFLTLPMRISDKTLGAISFSDMQYERHWADDLVHQLSTFTDIITNVLTRKSSHKELDLRLRFEELITELSSRFINLPSEKVDQQIDNSLELVVNALKVDRCSLFQYSEEGTEWIITNSFAQKGYKPTPRIQVRKDFPWVASKIQHGEILRIESLKNLPEEADLDRQNMARIHIKSTLVIPIIISGSIDYVLTLGSLKQERSWESDIIPRLQLIGEVFANALMRKRLDEEIHKSNKELSDRLRFEEFISKLSSHFVNLPSEKVDHQIEIGLKQVVEFLEVDRSSLIEISEDFKEIISKYTYAVKGVTLRQTRNLANHYRLVLGQLRLGKTVSFSSVDDLSGDIAGEIKKSDLKSGAALPISLGNSHNYVLTIGSVRKKRVFPDTLISRLKLIGEIFVNALVRKKADEKINHLIEQLDTDNKYLQDEVKLSHRFDEIVGKSAELKYILHQVEQVASTATPVLILGETGTGKDLIARAIHYTSDRGNRPLVKVNCSALPATLAESELFGYEKGAFTGANKQQIGRFEFADGATIFLDEVGDLPLEMQPKLLRVLENGEFERLGNPRTIKVDVRIIAATNRDLEKEIQKKRFRQDLFYRLNVYPLTIPPLRQRRDDIPLLVTALLQKISKKMRKQFKTIPQRSIRKMQSYNWPGNVRELENLIERAVITSAEPELHIELPVQLSLGVGGNKTLQEIDREHMLSVLKDTHWRIKGTNGAAEILGMNHSTLRDKMKKLGIKRPY
jgi:transcriptional regulator with GAF, ATPase, and Fis domain